MNRKTKGFLTGCAVACVLSLSPFKSQAADIWNGTDKLNHFAVSASIAKLTVSEYGTTAGMMLALVPGALKELSDLGGSGTPSVRDMIANFVGAIAGAVLPQQYMIAPIAYKGSVNGAMISYMIDF
jgi:VanZ family protein